jgi:hypothetical protein
MKFTILVKPFLLYITMHFFLHTCSFREEDLKKRSNLTLFAPPIGGRGAGHLKFTMYCPLVPKMHHTKFKKNWSSGYQEDVKKVQMLKDTIHVYHVWPPLGAKPLSRRL